MFTSMTALLFLISIILPYGLAQVPTASNQQYPYIHDPLYSTLSSECQASVTVCPPTVLSCAVTLCSICTSLGVTPSIEPCCAAPTPLACFSDYVAGSPITYTTPLSPTGTTPTSYNPGVAACGGALSISSTCAAATPEFAQLEFSSQYSCLCFTSGTFVPQRFDGFWSTCVAFVSTGAPGEYSQFGPTGGGDVVRTPCQRYASSTAGFPATSLPPTPGVSSTPAASAPAASTPAPSTTTPPMSSRSTTGVAVAATTTAEGFKSRKAPVSYESRLRCVNFCTNDNRFD